MSQTGSYVTALVWETSDGEAPTRAEYQTNWNAMDGHLHDNRGAGRGIRGIQTTSAPTQTGDIQINGDALQWWGATSGAVVTAVNPAVAIASLTWSGIAAIANTRFVGIVAVSGPPVSGTWSLYDWGLDEAGEGWFCTVAGSPGTWVPLSGPPSGTISMYAAGTTDPTGWLLCDGRAVSRTTFSRLFAAISTAYGAGDGSTTFNIPDLRGRFAMGADTAGTAAGAASRITSNGALGNTSGEDTHVLATGEVGAHSHTITDPGHPHTEQGNGAGGGGVQGVNIINTLASVNGISGGSSTASATTGVTINSTAGAAGHNNRPLNQVVNFIIKT